jgi:hypothetical protein
MTKLLALLLALTCISAYSMISVYKDILLWSYAGGMLTISGKGSLPNYTQAAPAPFEK